MSKNDKKLDTSVEDTKVEPASADDTTNSPSAETKIEPEPELEPERKPEPADEPEPKPEPAAKSQPETKPAKTDNDAPSDKKPLSKPLKITLITIGAILGIIIIALLAVNIFVRVTYAPFYNQAEEEFTIPGIDSGFIPQDIDYYDVGETWLYSGYMNDGSASPIYKRYVNGQVTEVFVKEPDGTLYTGHGSAITSNDKYIYLTCENGYLIFDAENLIALTSNETITAIEKVDLDFSPAFMNIENNELLLGNFYHPEAYETPEAHHIATLDGVDGGQNQAIMYVFGSNNAMEYGFSLSPVRVYSIPDRVQGVCATPNEKLIFSTSYGLASSHILVYDTKDMKPDGYFTTSSGDVPLYILDTRTQIEDLEAPPMTEGIETHEDRIYICDESATTKYLFGKLYGAGKVFSIPVPNAQHRDE